MVSFNEIYSRIGKLNSLTYALEGAVLDFTAELEASLEKERMTDLFYLLLEELGRLKMDADELNGHISVCNSILAIKEVDKIKAELHTLNNSPELT